MNLLIPPLSLPLGTFTDKTGNQFSMLPGGSISVTNQQDIQELMRLGCVPDPRGISQGPFPLVLNTPLGGLALKIPVDLAGQGEVLPAPAAPG